MDRPGLHRECVLLPPVRFRGLRREETHPSAPACARAEFGVRPPALLSRAACPALAATRAPFTDNLARPSDSPSLATLRTSVSFPRSPRPPLFGHRDRRSPVHPPSSVCRRHLSGSSVQGCGVDSMRWGIKAVDSVNLTERSPRGEEGKRVASGQLRTGAQRDSGLRA